MDTSDPAADPAAVGGQMTKETSNNQLSTTTEASAAHAVSGSATAVPLASTPAPRTLRARASIPALPPKSPSTTTPAGIRRPTEKELRQIQSRLGPEAVQDRKDELLKEKEEELRQVVDGHDTAVREKFHLERFVTMVTGWNPKVSIGSWTMV
jgi:helicase SWR1